MTRQDKTIFLVVPHGFAARYFLRTELLQTLTVAECRVVILAPNSEERYFKDEFQRDGVLVEKLEVEKIAQYLKKSRVQSLLRQIRVFVLNADSDITTIDDLYRIYCQERSRSGVRRKLRNVVLDASVWTLRRSRILRRMLTWLESTLYVGGFHHGLFDTYQPDLVVTSSLGYFRDDAYVMREARRHHVAVAAVILSWDNPTSWGMAGAFADYVVAQTDRMKEELIRLHDQRPSRIFVEGIACFDHYYHPELLPDRDTFFSKMGLDPRHPLILLATQSPNIFPWNADLIKLVARAIQDGRLPKECQLLVRLHPLHLRHRDGKPLYGHLMREYEQVQQEHPFVVFNCPASLSSQLEADMPRSEMIDVACMLRYADVLVNHFSTIAVEGCLHNLPTINVGYDPGDPKKKTQLKHSSALAERRTHNQRLIQAGGVRTAHREEELLRAINAYLKDPDLDAEQRAAVAAVEGGPYPGSAGRHIGERLLSFLDGD
jgi:hypothetical protein